MDNEHLMIPRGVGTLERWIMMNLHCACKGARETWRFHPDPSHFEPKEGHLGAGGPGLQTRWTWLILSKNEKLDPWRSFGRPSPFFDRPFWMVVMWDLEGKLLWMIINAMKLRKFSEHFDLSCFNFTPPGADDFGCWVCDTWEGVRDVANVGLRHLLPEGGSQWRAGWVGASMLADANWCKLMPGLSGLEDWISLHRYCDFG